MCSARLRLGFIRISREGSVRDVSQGGLAQAKSQPVPVDPVGPRPAHRAGAGWGSAGDVRADKREDCSTKGYGLLLVAITRP